MNRGRHHRHQINEIVKLAKQYGAHYPEAWKNSISHENLINLINTQKEKCRFNNLHIFETNYTTSNTTRGGFIWDTTKEGHIFWSKCLSRLYHGIQDYIKNKSEENIIKIKLK